MYTLFFPERDTTRRTMSSSPSPNPISLILFPQPFLLTDVKERLDDGRILEGADHVGIRPVAQEKTHGADDDRFTGAGLSGDDVETPVEGHLQFIDDGKITDVQFRQHPASSRQPPSGNRPIPVSSSKSPDSPGGGRRPAW